MKVYFLHSGNPVKTAAFNDQVHIRMRSVYDDAERIFDKKELVNAYSQMNSLKAAGIEIYEGILDHRSSFSHFIKSGKGFRKKVYDSSCELVHVTWGTFSALLAVVFSPVPVVISFCGSDILGGYSAKGTRAIKSNISILLSQLAAFKATKIIAKSARIKDAIWSSNRKKAVIIPNGVDLSSFYPIDRKVARAKLGWDEHQPVILFFHVNGQTVKNKPLAEEAVKIVKHRVPDTRLIVVENIPHNQLVHYYNGADVMLLTSFHEGSNNSVKEALACNLPVVSVNCGDITDRLNGVEPSAVVKAYDAQLLAGEVTKILSRPQRSNGQDAVYRISEPNIAQQIMKVYREALNK